MFTISDKPAATTAPAPLPAGSSLPADGAFAAALDMLCPQESSIPSSPANGDDAPATGTAFMPPETPFPMAALPILSGADVAPEVSPRRGLPTDTPLPSTPAPEPDEKKDEADCVNPAALPMLASAQPLPLPSVAETVSDSAKPRETAVADAALAPAFSREAAKGDNVVASIPAVPSTALAADPVAPLSSPEAKKGEAPVESIPAASSTALAASPTVLPDEAESQVPTRAVAPQTPDPVASARTAASRTPDRAASTSIPFRSEPDPVTPAQTAAPAATGNAPAQTPPASHLRLVLTDPRIEEPLATEIQPRVATGAQSFPRRITLRPAGELRLDISLDAPTFGDNAAAAQEETPLQADTTATRVAPQFQADPAMANAMPEPIAKTSGNKNGAPQFTVIQGAGEMPGLLRADPAMDAAGVKDAALIRQSGQDASGIAPLSAPRPSGERSGKNDSQEESTPQQAPFAAPQQPAAVSGAAATAPAHAVHYTAASEDDPVAQIIRAARFQLDNKHGGTVEMRLDPPALGHVRLQVTYQDGALTAFLGTETTAAQQLLEQQSGILRNALQECGLPVTALHVGLDYSYAQSGNQQPQYEPAQSFPQRDVPGETQSAPVTAPATPALWSSVGLDFLA